MLNVVIKFNELMRFKITPCIKISSIFSQLCMKLLLLGVDKFFMK